MQFKNAYKKLLVNNKVKSIKGNCFPLDSTYILNTYNRKVDELNTKNHVDINIIKKYDIKINETEEDQYDEIINFPINLSFYKETAITAIAGFVIKSLKKTVKCIDCISAIEDKTLQNSFLNLKAEQYSFINRPSADVVSICIETERYIQKMWHEKKIIK